jgi:hypothetical protein
VIVLRLSKGGVILDHYYFQLKFLDLVGLIWIIRFNKVVGSIGHWHVKFFYYSAFVGYLVKEVDERFEEVNLSAVMLKLKILSNGLIRLLHLRLFNLSLILYFSTLRSTSWIIRKTLEILNGDYYRVGYFLFGC